MSGFAIWPGPLVRRHLSRLIETLEDLIARLREKLARTVGEFTANAFHELSYLVTGSSPPRPSPPRWQEDRYHSEWDDDPYAEERYHEAEPEPIDLRDAPGSRLLRSLSIGLQTAAWWLARKVSGNPVVLATGFGVGAALLSYAGGPIIGVGLAGIAGAVLHLLGLSEAVEAGAAAVAGH